MQTISATLRTALGNTVVEAWPKLIAEFDHNITQSGISVSVPAGRDGELFPSVSVADMKYSDSGLPKAVVGNARVQPRSSATQYRLVSDSDTYQYWVSPSASGVGGGISNASVEVNYGTARPTNKVRAAFEVSDAAPTSVNLEVMVGGIWQTVATGVSPGADGVIQRFWNGTSWVTQESFGNTLSVTRVRATVTALSSAGKYAHFLNVSARYVTDLSDRVIDWSVTKNQEELDPISPIGFGSVNTFDARLENSDGAFDPENAGSVFSGMLKRNVILRPYAVYQTSAGVEEIPQGTFYTESWSVNVPDIEAGVEATDLARPMQESFTEPFFLENYTSQEAVQDMLHRGGFSDITFDTVNGGTQIPYLWHEGDSSVWDTLKELAGATLSYLIRREDGSLLWQNIERQYTKAVSRSLSAGADFEDIQHEFDSLINKVKIDYNIYGKPFDKWADEEITQELWYAQEDEALLATPIAASFTAAADVVRLSTSSEQFALWPESGAFSIQGERIRYGAKRINGSFYELYDLERGVLGTSPRDHSASGAGSSVTSGGTVTSIQTIIDGQLQLTASASATYSTYNYSLYGNASSQYTVYGARISFPHNRADAVAGLTIHNNGSSGYHFMISTTEHANRSSTNEVKVYRYNGPGSRTPLGNASGYPLEVDIGAWYDVEVTASYSGVTPTYNLYINGNQIMSFVDGTYTQGQYGVYIKGRTTARFDRLYVASPTTAPDLSYSRYSDPDSSSSWSSDYWFSAIGPGVEVNEFGPYARQLKEFDVDFQKFPAQSSNLLSTNVWQARPINYVGNPFGATFAIENITSRLAVLNGESRVFAEPVQMALLTYGVPIIVESEESATFKDKDSIRMYGELELDMSNPWIQTEAMANYVGKFVTDKFRYANLDNITVNAIADPSLQVGDVVTIDYAERGYTPATHEYIVAGYDIAWEDGFMSTLQLKRRR